MTKAFKPLSKLTNQREWMEDLLRSHNLTLVEWKSVTSTIIRSKRGGARLLRYYSGNLTKLLSTLFTPSEWAAVLPPHNQSDNNQSVFQQLLHLNPNHRHNAQKKPLRYWNSTENQRNFMQTLFSSLQVKDQREWNKITNKQIAKLGGARLLSKFKSKHALLHSLNPLYSKEQLTQFHGRQRLLDLQRCWLIQRKEDWTRLTGRSLFKTLQFCHPDQHWERRWFQTRFKKYKQRSFFILCSRYFPQHLILEDYWHPGVRMLNLLQFDLFIPSLNLVLEYNGEQHYDDMPKAFPIYEKYRHTEELKVEFCSQQNIQLYSIPYWVSSVPFCIIPLLHHCVHKRFIY